jgi:hypothetical protein
MDNKWIIFFIIGIMLLSALVDILTPKIKGWVGETVVSTVLSKLPRTEYRIINNVMLKTNRGTTQIDHIVVSLYGIFVIETKNYKGWIIGNDNSEQWTKNMYGKKYPFRNPIKQNWGHVKALEDLLELSADYFIPIVVFANEATLKVKTDDIVINTSKLRKTVKSYHNKIIDCNELNAIVRKIDDSNVDSKENRKRHVADIHNNISEQKKSVKAGICPRCNGTLLKRHGKYGDFIGCSNYPKCKFTK